MNFGNITRRTKHYLLMGLLSTLSGVTFAQSYYEFIRYRSNDPLCSAPRLQRNSSTSMLGSSSTLPWSMGIYRCLQTT